MTSPSESPAPMSVFATWMVIGFAVAMMLGIGGVAGGPTILGLPGLVVVAFVALIIQWLAFLPAYWLRTEHFYDLIGSMTFAGLAIAGLWAATRYGSVGPRQLLVTVLVLLWSGRLGAFLFHRVRTVGQDARFEHIKHSAPRFLMAWTLQGLWVFVTSLAALLLITQPSSHPLGLWDALGTTLWTVGWGIEVIADRQKSAFRRNPANTHRWIDSGLWSWSQHPNYFGEIILWCGITVIGVGVFEGVQWIGCLSPVFVGWLLLRVSGIPPLEARAHARWGDDPAYRAYTHRTSRLVLRPPTSHGPTQ